MGTDANLGGKSRGLICPQRSDELRYKFVFCVCGFYYRRAKLPCEVGAVYVFVVNEDEKMGRDWPAEKDRREAAGKKGRIIEGSQVLKGFAL